jgi:hypothetical protein
MLSLDQGAPACAAVGTLTASVLLLLLPLLAMAFDTKACMRGLTTSGASSWGQWPEEGGEGGPASEEVLASGIGSGVCGAVSQRHASPCWRHAKAQCVRASLLTDARHFHKLCTEQGGTTETRSRQAGARAAGCCPDTRLLLHDAPTPKQARQPLFRSTLGSSGTPRLPSPPSGKQPLHSPVTQGKCANSRRPSCMSSQGSSAPHRMLTGMPGGTCGRVQ